MVLKSRRCDECDAPFQPKKASAVFCCTACCKAYNNRRMMRGALFYDLFMVPRFDRSLATTLKVWKKLCRLAAYFRWEDIERRGGRKSWADPREVLEKHHYLGADIWVRGTRR